MIAWDWCVIHSDDHKVDSEGLFSAMKFFIAFCHMVVLLFWKACTLTCAILVYIIIFVIAPPRRKGGIFLCYLLARLLENSVVRAFVIFWGFYVVLMAPFQLLYWVSANIFQARIRNPSSKTSNFLHQDVSRQWFSFIKECCFKGTKQ